jgi:uncharacterized tellurite resistance protein B-like protein
LTHGEKGEKRMSDVDLIFALAKVVIVAAWADGEMSIEEVNSLKRLLFNLPNMTARDWASLDIYMEEPIDELERGRLIQELKREINTPKDKQLVFSALNNLISANGEISAEEHEVVQGIQNALDDVNVSIFGQLGRLVKKGIHRETQADIDAHNRELHLEDFIRNKIFYSVNRRLNKQGDQLDISEKELRKLSLVGGLMARVAHVDYKVNDEEFEFIAKTLQNNWNIDYEKAYLVTEIAISEISRQLDYYRLTREFFESTTENERLRFVEVLFSVAQSDGELTFEETEEIRRIAYRLKLTRRQFIQSKRSAARKIAKDE